MHNITSLTNIYGSYMTFTAATAQRIINFIMILIILPTRANRCYYEMDTYVCILSAEYNVFSGSLYAYNVIIA